MPKSKFTDIHDELEREIVSGAYEGGMLPTEAQLVERYGCSRNTVRRAIAQLADEGYVQSIRGRGVVVLDRLSAPAEVLLDMRDFSGARAISGARTLDVRTTVLAFSALKIDEGLAARTSLPAGETALHLERLRILDGHPWILDVSYFLADVVAGITIEDAERSVYRYIEEHSGHRIIASRRVLAIKKATKHDREHLELDGFNCVGIILNNAFIDTGRLFEFTETRYSPDHFAFTQFLNA